MTITLFALTFLNADLLASEPDWSGAKKIIVVLPDNSGSDTLDHKAADNFQLRLRRLVDQSRMSGYVLSWGEMEAYLQDLTFEGLVKNVQQLSLREDQELYILWVSTFTNPDDSSGAYDMGFRLRGFEVAKKRDGTVTVGGILAYGNYCDIYTKWEPKDFDILAKHVFGEIVGKEKLPATQPASQPAVTWSSVSIVHNGTFEEGSGYRPRGWDSVDELCSFWVKEGRGKCLMFDTDVQQGQAWDWWKAIKSGASPAGAPKPIRTQPPHYDAVGGIEGVKLYSDTISIRPGKSYLLSARVKGPAKGSAKIFVKAYAMLPTVKSNALERREVWQTYMHCGTKGDGWREFEQAFTLPAELPVVEKKNAKGTVREYQPRIQWIRVMPYAYWEVGKYYIDDIRIRPSTK